MSDNDACGVNPTDRLGLRIGAIFIIMVTSMFGTLFPIITKRTNTLRKIVPGIVFEFTKFFGSGVILATALIHLLEPAADDELGPANTISMGGCISDSWGDYPYAFGICLASLFVTFVIELVAFRVGTSYLAKRGLEMPAPHGIGAMQIQQTQIDPESAAEPTQKVLADKALEDSESTSSDDRFRDASEANPATAQILGVVILEFGVLFHSVIIGLTLSLASPDEFTTLFIVIVFHQMFEGLGLGTRLAFLKLPDQYRLMPVIGALLYAFMTPIGMAIGLGTRESTSMTAASGSIASGILDATSAGILLYAATVELIAHEFIFNHFYHTCSWPRVISALFFFALGSGIMALLGKWA
ncbi:ZIP-like iron-zinc transporter [Naematelia encephala]|uniref:ZIP-like iron-zinc transporter n=1 Tax=Naematelia encephala TaxID=71784 RepID=A0A1Y2BJB1_9TREE|nr:ZIP-like iron-zinc transporter [Naematelia encephala]